MSIKNGKKKLTREDKFARKYYCQHARLNSIRNDKKQCTRKIRRINRRECKRGLNINEDN